MRKDSAGNVVEVGDIVASFPKGGGFSIGQVTGVFKSGRVTFKLPQKRAIYAYEQGAPDIEVQSTRRQLKAGVTAPRGYSFYRPEDYEDVPYTYTRQDYTVVGHYWKWIRTQAADIHLLILRKHDGTSLYDFGGEVSRGLSLDYSTEKPELPV